ncbi:MAG: CRP-like cAMP-binding protein [Porticoccus sp.]
METTLPQQYLGNNWINQLPDGIQQSTLALMKSCQYDKGEVIYAEGLIPSALWQVASGTVRMTNTSVDGKEVVFAIFEAGDCFGEISMIDGKASANTAIAQEACELLELKRQDFNYLYNEYPEVPRQLNAMLAERTRHLVSFYQGIALRPLESRLAHRLCYLTGNLLDKNTISPASLEISITQQDIGAMLGATRQAVSKILNQWRDEDVISIEYGKITILNTSYLATLAI